MIDQTIVIWVNLYRLNQEAIDYMKCQECHNEMIKFKDDHVQGWQCENCGWNILTSNINSEYKPNKYNICIQTLSNNDIDINIIKIFAKIAKVNYLISKKILLNGNYYIENLNEMEIEKLKQANIPFEIINSK